MHSNLADLSPSEKGKKREEKDDLTQRAFWEGKEMTLCSTGTSQAVELLCDIQRWLLDITHLSERRLHSTKDEPYSKLWLVVHNNA